MLWPRVHQHRVIAPDSTASIYMLQDLPPSKLCKLDVGNIVMSQDTATYAVVQQSAKD